MGAFPWNTAATSEYAAHPDWAKDLSSFRKLLQDAWSDKTLHQSFKPPAGAAVPPSQGQCGVSSAWLVETLVGMSVEDVTYCYGKILRTRSRQAVLRKHCWIEIEPTASRSRLIVDLTGDQAKTLRDHQVLCGWAEELRAKHRLIYKAEWRLTPQELEGDRVQDRLALLKHNLAGKL
jgi:hypothetical protein